MQETPKVVGPERRAVRRSSSAPATNVVICDSTSIHAVRQGMVITNRSDARCDGGCSDRGQPMSHGPFTPHSTRASAHEVTRCCNVGGSQALKKSAWAVYGDPLDRVTPEPSRVGYLNSTFTVGTLTG
jgi:hypothetical protein